MKAIDYVKKYGEKLSLLHRTNLDECKPETIQEISSELELTMSSIFYDFIHEYRDMVQKRKVLSFSGRQSVAKELNDKWNAVIKLMEKQYGIGVLQRNAFYNDWKNGRVVA